MKLWGFIIILIYCSKGLADPYKLVSREQFSNGLEVFFAPGKNSNTVTILIEIEAGWNQETLENQGVAHLLEHTLFRHESLPTNMTFMEVVKEEGGDGNGFTMAKKTQYFATIKSSKNEWLMEWYAKLIIGRRINSEYIEKGKKEVLLEIGEPESQLMQAFNKIINPIQLPQLGFWKTEFGIKDQDYDEDKVRESTIKLDLKKTQKFYDDFYHPANMNIYVAGNFDVSRINNIISKTFGKMPSKGTLVSQKETPHPRLRPYEVSNISNNNTQITLGTKVWDLDAADEMVLRSYLGFLSHRLMKDIRNNEGETYTVMEQIQLSDGFGYGAVTLEASRERFRKNLNAVRQLIEREARQGEISKEQFEQAKELFLKKFEIIDNDSKSLLFLASSKKSFCTDYNESRSPYTILKNITYEDFQIRLIKMFRKNQIYSELYVPPLFFRGEQMVFALLFGLLSFLGLKMVLIQKFEYTKLRYVRKNKYSIVSLLGMLILLFFPILVIELYYYAVKFLWDSLGLRSTIFTNVYLKDLFFAFGVVSVMMLYLSLWPRKIIVMDKYLIIKSLTYYSYKIPFTDIEEFKVIEPLRIFGEFSLRFRYINFSVFQTGIYLKTRSGIFNRYFFGFKDAQQVFNEINAVTQQGNMEEKNEAA